MAGGIKAFNAQARGYIVLYSADLKTPPQTSNLNYDIGTDSFAPFIVNFGTESTDWNQQTRKYHRGWNIYSNQPVTVRTEYRGVFCRPDIKLGLEDFQGNAWPEGQWFFP